MSVFLINTPKPHRLIRHVARIVSENGRHRTLAGHGSRDLAWYRIFGYSIQEANDDRTGTQCRSDPAGEFFNASNSSLSRSAFSVSHGIVLDACGGDFIRIEG